MARSKRITLGGIVYHVLNRANGKLTIFRSVGEFKAFERILAEGIQRFDMRMCGYCIMSNHWHLVLWPKLDGDLSEFMRWVTVTHTQRWHASHGTTGTGHIYQGRFKSFPVQRDGHYLSVLRYVESNALRAGMVVSSGDWLWSSFAVRCGAEKDIRLSRGPVRLPEDWAALVDDVDGETEHVEFERCVKRGCPFGGQAWVKVMARKLGLESTLRVRGRPRKGS